MLPRRIFHSRLKQIIVGLCLISAAYPLIWYVTSLVTIGNQKSATTDDKEHQQNTRSSDNEIPVLLHHKDMPVITPVPIDLHNTSGVHIPKIIHQTWETDYVPKEMAKWILSWRKFHPNWTYILWTSDCRDEMVRQYFPQYSDLFHSYTYQAHRADAIRYYLLHTFGGFYADLDMECLKPLDDLIPQHSCIIAQEPEAHGYFLFARNITITSTAVMGCRPNHQFTSVLIKGLPRFSGTTDLLQSTGPMMLDTVTRDYLKLLQKLDHYKMEEIFLAPPDFFNPTFDPMHISSFKLLCANITASNSSEHLWKKELRNTPQSYFIKYQQLCRRLQLEGFKNMPTEDAYSNHYWLHTYWYKERFFSRANSVHINEVVPTATSCKDFLAQHNPEKS